MTIAEWPHSGLDGLTPNEFAAKLTSPLPQLDLSSITGGRHLSAKKAISQAATLNKTGAAKEIWHPNNAYTKRIRIHPPANSTLGEGALAVASNSAAALFKMKRRRLDYDKEWILVSTKRIDWEPGPLTDYIRALQAKGHIHAGQRSIKRELILRGFPREDFVPAGHYNEYRQELCGIFREAFLLDGERLWRTHSWNFRELKALLRKMEMLTRRRQNLIRARLAHFADPESTPLPKKQPDDAGYDKVRNAIEPLFRFFVRYERPEGVSQAIPFINIPSLEHIPDAHLRTVGRLLKYLTGRWPSPTTVVPGRPTGESEYSKRMKRLIWEEYLHVKGRTPPSSLRWYAKTVYSNLHRTHSGEFVPTPERIRNILSALLRTRAAA